MAGRRPLSDLEERSLLRVVRRLHPRDRALLTIQWFTGFRISEVLSLTVGQVYRGGELLPRIGVPPRHLKGSYGSTRYVPVTPEMQRALERHWRWLSRRFDVTPEMPLFPSRKKGKDGRRRAIHRVTAHELFIRVFAKAGISNDGRLGTHTLRKTFAKNVYKNSGHDLVVLKKALHHAQVDTTIRYLDIDAADIDQAITACDFTRRPRRAATLDSPPLPSWPSV